ncbi:MAG TPA: flagellar motor switch protein FliG [Candidatus Treponema faecavium]|nr:flagellar motor switch protein FliG [Candidatus Treponema faecavium]
MELNNTRIRAYRRAAGNKPEHSDMENPPARAGRQAAAQAETQHGTPLSESDSRITAGLLKVPAAANAEDGAAGKDSNYRRVAKFLLLIGTDEAAKVISHLSPEQTERIIPEIASIRRVDPDEAAVILAEFQTLLKRSREGGGVETARTILEKAYGTEKAGEMLQKAVPFADGVPFEYLQEMDSDRVFYLLHDESPGIRALVLSRLKPALAAGVINRMKPEDKKETVYRLAKMSSVSPEMLRGVDQAMHEKVLAVNTAAADTMDGRNALSEILKRMPPSAEQSILDCLAEQDPELGSDIRERLFTIDDAVNADNKFIQQHLHKMSNEDIAYLIAGKPDSFRDKILNNVSKGRSAYILEEERLRRPMRKKDCDRVTIDFFGVLRRAWEEGRLFIKNRTDDIYV